VFFEAKWLGVKFNVQGFKHPQSADAQGDRHPLAFQGLGLVQHWLGPEVDNHVGNENFWAQCFKGIGPKNEKGQLAEALTGGVVFGALEVHPPHVLVAKPRIVQFTPRWQKRLELAPKHKRHGLGWVTKVFAWCWKPLLNRGWVVAHHRLHKKNKKCISMCIYSARR